MSVFDVFNIILSNFAAVLVVSIQAGQFDT